MISQTVILLIGIVGISLYLIVTYMDQILVALAKAIKFFRDQNKDKKDYMSSGQKEKEIELDKNRLELINKFKKNYDDFEVYERKENE